jgi:hypothetical protein
LSNHYLLLFGNKFHFITMGFGEEMEIWEDVWRMGCKGEAAVLGTLRATQ